MDDELNILPISSHVMSAIEPFKVNSFFMIFQEGCKLRPLRTYKLKIYEFPSLCYGDFLGTFFYSGNMTMASS